MLLEPLDRRADIHIPQVHHQIDRPTATFVAMPVEELGTRYRKRALFGVPLIPVG
jgi:hypothetical protein